LKAAIPQCFSPSMQIFLPVSEGSYLAYIMLLAVLNGLLGFLCAIGVAIYSSLGVAKVLGEAIALSYGWIIALTIGCGVLRGILRFFEQYSNHYIVFRLLAVLRQDIRQTAPAVSGEAGE
jgi:ATP-binding cassette, subfamily C, bacterial